MRRGGDGRLGRAQVGRPETRNEPYLLAVSDDDDVFFRRPERPIEEEEEAFRLPNDRMSVRRDRFSTLV